MNHLEQQIVDAHAYLRPFAIKLTKDSEEAKDLLQETLTKAIVHKKKFQEGTNLKGWMYTIMRNTFITKYHRVTQRFTSMDTQEESYKLDKAGRTVENTALSSLVVKDVRIALDKVDEKFRTPFQMYFIGYKYKEIADKLNIPIGTVKNRIHQARIQLKEELKSYSN